MKYTLQLNIALPRDKVVELYDNPDHWPKWHENLISSHPLDGSRREKGAKTKLIQKIGLRETEIVETIESKHLPEEITCTYTAPGAWNRVTSRFAEIGPNETRWEFESEFRCTGFLRVLAFLMPGMFRKASVKEMASFKRFAESHRSEGSAATA